MKLGIVMVAVVGMVLAGCGREEPAAATAPVKQAVKKVEAPKAMVVEEVPAPAGAGAAESFLFATRDGLLLSWLEPVKGSKRTAMRFARYAGGQWSEPRTIVERDDLFVNWADFPSIAEDAKGVLFAHWLQKSGGDSYAYDVRMATSSDGGVTWSKAFLLNRDGHQAEHGFVSLAALPDSGIGAAWLDGRNMTGGDHGHGGGDMTLRYATVDAAGTIAGEVEVDGRTCECCATGMAMIGGDPVIAYRDRSDGEIRDISFVKRTAAGWTAPRALNEDGWKIDGCPVNGPQIDAIGEHAAAAWFTAAKETQRAYVAFSADGGVSFGKPIVIDDGKPVGRVDVVMLDESNALVTWLEQTPSGAEIRARRVSSEGKAEPSVKVADSSASRAAGFTRIARTGNEVWFTWTEQTATEKRIHVARAGL